MRRMFEPLPILALLLLLAVSISSRTPELFSAEATPAIPGPVVRVVSPSGGVANLVTPSGEAKVLVVLEMTDRSGSGLDTDDSGTPRFDEPDTNVSLFRRHITRRSEFTNHLGQTVTQLVADVPLKDVVFSTEMKLTPPINTWSPNTSKRKKGFSIPPEAMSDVAIFKFRARDRSGNVTDPKKDENQFLLAVAWSLYTPPLESESDEEIPPHAPAEPPQPNPVSPGSSSGSE